MKVLKKTLQVISSPKSGDRSIDKGLKRSNDKKADPNDKKSVKVTQKYYININYSSNAMRQDDASKRLNSFTSKNTILKTSIDKNKMFEVNNKTTGQGKLKILPRRHIVSQKNFVINEDSKSNGTNSRKNNEGNSCKNIMDNYLIANNKKPSFFYIDTPANANQPSTSKLRIVSRDKCAKKSIKSKIFKMSVQDRQNTASTKKSLEKNTSVKNPKAVELYMKLEKLVNAKSRSIDLNKNGLKKGGRVKNDIVSEDKDQTKYMMGEKPICYLTNKKELINDESQIGSMTKTRKNNKYYQYLIDKLKNHSDITEICEIVKTKFNNWKKKDIAEIFEFETCIDFYKIKQKIGKGCFGKVYLATQLLTNTSVALKAISKTNMKNKDARKKIEKEVDILKRINNSSHIIRLYEVFEDKNYVYLVFEYLANGDLVKYFKQNPLFDEPEQKNFFKKIVQGVEYLHSNQILHRDIKLDNILLDSKMNPKLCDFGISSIQELGKKIYDTGGTPAYLAPEVIKAEGDVCAKSDVWSLGILLYLLTFGIVPFKANDMQVLYNKIIVGRYKFPENDFASDELLSLIKSMLVADVKMRISTQEILNHKWFNNSESSFLDSNEAYYNKKKEQLRIEGIIMYLEDLGFPHEYIMQTRNKNLFNHVKACIDSLLEKFKSN